MVDIKRDLPSDVTRERSQGQSRTEHDRIRGGQDRVPATADDSSRRDRNYNETAKDDEYASGRTGYSRDIDPDSPDSDLDRDDSEDQR